MSDYYCGKYPVIDNSTISNGIYSLVFKSADIASAAKAGQFVQVRVPGFTLRRPVSVCDVDVAAGTVRLVYEVRGEGTAVLAGLHPGDGVDVIAPLGNGYPAVPGLTLPGCNIPRVLLAGGGIGVPPLLLAARTLAATGCDVSAYLGFRDSSRVILTDEFKSAGAAVESYVGGTFISDINVADYHYIFACGPAPMLKAIAGKCAGHTDTALYLSLEERMACGVGACVGCAVRVRDGDGTVMKRVCKDGPVFSGSEVCFE
ncbi:dihydroorotate dehydrogenase [Clostridia bacterium]|nr:dihydroorotate dehydrogenase [Clostridia bacterium]